MLFKCNPDADYKAEKWFLERKYFRSKIPNCSNEYFSRWELNVTILVVHNSVFDYSYHCSGYYSSYRTCSDCRLWLVQETWNQNYISFSKRNDFTCSRGRQYFLSSLTLALKSASILFCSLSDVQNFVYVTF